MPRTTIVVGLAREKIPSRLTQWPIGCFVQGGRSGVVFSRRGSYITAFVEAFPAEGGFFRGEGETLEDAEVACLKNVLRAEDCLRHVFEPRGYTNGAGFCARCGMFKSDVFTAEDLEKIDPTKVVA